MAKARTTIMVDEEILKESKMVAIQKGVSLSRLIEDAMRQAVEGGQAVAQAEANNPLLEFMRWADDRKLCSDDGKPLTREEAHERS